MTRVVNKRHTGEWDVDITRLGPWGNPFRIGHHGATRADVVALHRAWFLAQPELVARVRRELTGRVLACVCKPQACHGDVYVEVCESEATPGA